MTAGLNQPQRQQLLSLLQHCTTAILTAQSATDDIGGSTS